MHLSLLEVRTGEKEVKIVNSYLYQDNQLRTNFRQQQSEHRAEERKTIENESDIASVTETSKMQKQMQQRLPKAQPSNNKSNLLLKKALTKPPIKQDSSSQARPQSQSSQGEQIKGLVALLHSAIQSQQQYPSSALQMNRQGKVTVSFKLYPDGSISDLQLVKSSGVKSLDEAALTAVRSAVPFSGVNVYLKAPLDFNIDVVFALEQSE